MPTVVYVASADSREIFVAHLDNATGALEVVQQAAVPGVVMPLAISPSRTFLYACLRSEPFAAAILRIDPASGMLTLLSTVPLPDNMAYIATDKTGRFLLAASYSGDRISINPVGADGVVNAPPVQVVATDPHPHSIATDPSNRYVFVPSLGGDVVLQYRFDSRTGRVTPNTPPTAAAKPKAGPRHLVFHPSLRFAYCTNELDATVGAFRLDEGGTLAPIGTNTLLPPGHAGRAPFASADIHVTPDGRYLYASERASNCLAGFKIDAQTGDLMPAGTYLTEDKPRGFNIDPRGRWLLAVGQVSHHLTSYAISAATGSLTPQHRYPMGRNPNWVEIVDLG